MQSSLSMVTRQWCLFFVFFKKSEDMLRALGCEPTPQLQNYSNLWMIMYQENLTDFYVLVLGKLNWFFCVGICGCCNWFHYLSPRSWFWIWFYIILSLKKFRLPEKCQPNLIFCSQLKFSTTLRYMPFTHIIHTALWDGHSTHFWYIEVRRLSKNH